MKEYEKAIRVVNGFDERYVIQAINGVVGGGVRSMHVTFVNAPILGRIYVFPGIACSVYLKEEDGKSFPSVTQVSCKGKTREKVDGFIGFLEELLIKDGFQLKPPLSDGALRPELTPVAEH